ncbi:hypothetical protein [Parageobacillus toebii]|uniref:hypothetical protein n=1 Tax=Parageobacillus toebii TaxID=153151 RepID=UPI0019679C7C|nr:hypothetical protein [Parageobacillus toebii]QSB50617.1 hypothetical protein JTI59_17800 [Parageobacillus toebii]
MFFNLNMKKIREYTDLHVQKVELLFQLCDSYEKMTDRDYLRLLHDLEKVERRINKLEKSLHYRIEEVG